VLRSSSAASFLRSWICVRHGVRIRLSVSVAGEVGGFNMGGRLVQREAGFPLLRSYDEECK
jgi:hypothetical protein